MLSTRKRRVTVSSMASGAQGFWDGVSDAAFAQDGKGPDIFAAGRLRFRRKGVRSGVAAEVFLTFYVSSCLPSGVRCLLAHIIHQIVDVEDISAGKDPWDTGLQRVVDRRAAGYRMQFNAGASGEFVLRDQPAGEQKACHSRNASPCQEWVSCLLPPGLPSRR